MKSRRINKVLSAKQIQLNLPFYILFGLFNAPSAIHTDDSFLSNKETWKQVVRWAKELSNEQYSTENILGMFYVGWQRYYGVDLHEKYFSPDKMSQLIERYKLDTFRLLKAVLNGVEYRDWYKQTRMQFVLQLPEYDTDLLIKLFAITSPQTHPGSNLMLALKAYDCLVNKEYSLLQLPCFDSVRGMLFEIEEGTFDDNAHKLSRRKVVNFMHSLNGDSDAVVVDSWMLNVCSLGKLYFWKSKGRLYTKCRKREYDLIEYYIKALAEVSGFEPRQLTAMAWVGVRIIEGKYKLADMGTVIQKVKKTMQIA